MTTNQYRLSIRASALMAGILLLFAGRLGAQTYTLSPPPFLEVRTLAGAIIPNGCVWTYAAGTTTPIATYLDTSGTVNGNPIIADSYGRFVAYLLPGTNYKFTYEATPCSAPSTHGTVLKSQDNIQGVPASSNNVDVGGTAGEALAAGQCAYLSDGSGAKTQGQWYKCDSANTYSSTLPTVGIPIASISSATTGTFRIAGSVTGLSSLTTGAAYFVSAVAGTMTATAPANRRLVGTADSTTSMIVAGNPAIMTAAASGTASTSTFWRGDQTWSAPGALVLTSTAVGTQTPLAPGILGTTVVRLNNATLQTIATFETGVDGQEVELISIGAGQVDINDSAAALGTAAQRIITGTSQTISLAPGLGRVRMRYDGTTARWRVILHEQGQIIGYTTSWVSSGTAVSLGNATLNAHYYVRGKQVTMHLYFSPGTTTTFGTGTYTFTLPFTASSTVVGQASGAMIFDTSATTFYVGAAYINTTTTITVVTSTGQIGQNIPMAWNTGDLLLLELVYYLP